jgi:hypothetical protein
MERINFGGGMGWGSGWDQNSVFLNVTFLSIFVFFGLKWGNFRGAKRRGRVIF